jgi:hypothetical protein
MPTIKNTNQSLAELEKILRSYKKAFYIRFGDIDIFFMKGYHYQTGQPITSAHGNNKTMFSDKLQQELKSSFSIQHKKFMKACSGNWSLEPGMTTKVFAPFKSRKTFDSMLSSLSPENHFWHPWLFQYLSVFNQPKLDAFLNEFVKPKRKMFVGSTPKELVEIVTGKLDYYIETPKTNSYATIDDWYPKMISILESLKNSGNEIPVIILNSGQASRVVAGRIWNNKNIGGHFLDFGSLFHAVGGINDRWWIKEKGKSVRQHYRKHSFNHFILTRVNYTNSSKEWLSHRIELFEKYTIPSILKQTSKNFTWLWLCDSVYHVDWIKELASKYIDQINIVPIFQSGTMDAWQSHFINYINQNVAKKDIEFLITSRLDNDDMLAPEYIETVQKHTHCQTEILDFEGYQLNAQNDDLYICNKYTEKPSPFSSLIEEVSTAPFSTVVIKDHTKLLDEFGTYIKIQNPLFTQVIHDQNLKNKIPSNQSPIVFKEKTISVKKPTIQLNDNKKTIVIPFISGPLNSLELRYALRSIHTNFIPSHDLNLVIIGDKPDWLENAIHIPTERISGMDYMVFKDTWNKINIATQLEGIGSGFFYSYDDIFFIKHITPNQLYLPRALQNISTIKEPFANSNASRKWKKIIQSTIHQLELRDIYPIYNFETHCPRYYKVLEMKNIIDNFNTIEHPLQMATLYFNLTCKNPIVIGADGGNFKFSPESNMTLKELKSKSSGCKIMNISKDRIHELNIQKFLDDMFPHPSPFEKKK